MERDADRLCRIYHSACRNVGGATAEVSLSLFYRAALLGRLFGASEFKQGAQVEVLFPIR